MKPMFLTLACLAIAGTALPAPARAQDVAAPCRLCSGEDRDGEKEPAKPVKLEVEASLNFDRLVTAGSGVGFAELGPDGSRRVSGAITAMSPRAMVGEVVIRGEPGREVRVDLPRTIELTGFSGGSIRVESIRSDLPSLPRLDSSGRLHFRFGGVIHVTGDADGEFRGDARIEVDYL